MIIIIDEVIVIPGISVDTGISTLGIRSESSAPPANSIVTLFSSPVNTLAIISREMRYNNDDMKKDYATTTTILLLYITTILYTTTTTTSTTTTTTSSSFLLYYYYYYYYYL